MPLMPATRARGKLISQKHIPHLLQELNIPKKLIDKTLTPATKAMVSSSQQSKAYLLQELSS